MRVEGSGIGPYKPFKLVCLHWKVEGLGTVMLATNVSVSSFSLQEAFTKKSFVSRKSTMGVATWRG